MGLGKVERQEERAGRDARGAADYIARQLQRSPAPSKTIVFSESGSFQNAIRALRSGAVDFIRTPLDLDEFADRIENALQRTPTEAEREKQITKLRQLCRELSSARDEISAISHLSSPWRSGKRRPRPRTTWRCLVRFCRRPYGGASEAPAAW